MLEIHASSLYAPAPPHDDEGALLLLAAVCRQARTDAKAGNRAAAEFLADVATVRPSNWRFTRDDAPLRFPHERRQPTIGERALPLARAAGWPGKLKRGAMTEIARELGCTPNGVCNALKLMRQALDNDEPTPMRRAA